MDVIRCPECPSAFFKEKKNLYAHIRKFHDKKSEVENISEVKKTNKNLDGKSDLHNYASSSTRTSRLKCPYENCFELFFNYKTLNVHLLKEHSVEIEVEDIIFYSMEGMFCFYLILVLI